MRQANITISQTAIRHNLNRVRALAPTSKILAMVKANAYGHGIKLALPALLQADAFGVACMQEAEDVHEELLRLGLTEDIGICLIEGVFSKQEWIQAQEINAMCVIHQEQQLNWALAERFTKQPVWLKINTGMNRLGFTVDIAFAAYEQLHEAGYKVILSMHYANADEKNHALNQQQYDRFNDIVMQIKHKLKHIPTMSVCNSAALVNFPEQHLDWVRPGIMLYGATPVTDKSATELDLHAGMSFTASIFNTYSIKKGESIGYGSTWTAKKNTQIGIVSIGYGDGYPRTIKEGIVWCNGESLAIIGRVSMDMLAVDLTDRPSIQNGDKVELWGDNLSVDVVANKVGTISYELLCRVTNRPTRAIC